MLYIMILFSILAGLDYMLNNKYGLGEKFEEGFSSMGGISAVLLAIIMIKIEVKKEEEINNECK